MQHVWLLPAALTCTPHHHKLPTGSFLNAGNKDGAASGFQVDALLRLKDVRSTRARCVGRAALYKCRNTCSLHVFF